MNSELKQKLDDVNAAIDEKRTEAQDNWGKFEEARDKFTKSGEDAMNTESEAFKEMDEINKAYSQSADDLKDLEAVRDGVFRAMAGEEPPSFGADTPDLAQTVAELSKAGGDVKSIGQLAVESEAYKTLKESGVLKTEHGSFNVALAQSSIEDLKAAILTAGSSTSAGAFIVPEQKGYVPLPMRPTTILDLITIGTTESDSVEFVRQTGFTNNAAPVAEATSATTGTKPESSLAFVKVPEAVKTLAHWMASTRKALADAGQLSTIIDGQLRYGLQYVLENQVVNGDGSGENFTGILHTPSILKQAKEEDSVADASHKALTQARLGYIEPTGYSFHPTDWEEIRLSKDDNGQYLFGPPSQVGAETLWGKPVAQSAAMPEGTGLAAAWLFATLWLREGTQVYAMDQHSDWAVKNLILVLAEMRAAFGVQLTSAFCEITGI
jgi:HK97 family phage major capsid protein